MWTVQCTASNYVTYFRGYGLLQKERNSSFEILRIISMLLIVMHHYSVHGGFDLVNNFNGKIYFVQVLQMYGKLGVNLFVLISGYFLSTSKFSWKRIVKLELEVIFYSVVIGLAFHIFYPERESIKDLLKEFTPLRSGNYRFYTTYFVLVIFSPFINILIETIERIKYEQLLLIISIIWVFIPMIPKFSALQMSNLGWFVSLYLFSGYIKKYPDSINKQNKYYFVVSTISFVLIAVSVLAFDILGLYKKVFQTKFAYFMGMNSVLVFITSISMFVSFSKWNIGSKKMINIISSATFGVYLIHDNNLVRNFLWIDLFKNRLYVGNSKIFIHAVLVILIVYCFCTIVDLLRQYFLEKPLFLLFDKLKTKFERRNT